MSKTAKNREKLFLCALLASAFVQKWKWQTALPQGWLVFTDGLDFQNGITTDHLCIFLMLYPPQVSFSGFSFTHIYAIVP